MPPKNYKKFVPKIFKKGNIEQRLYPAGSPQRFIQEHFFAMTAKEMSKKFDLSPNYLERLIVKMRREGNIPAKLEVISDYLKSLKRREKTKVATLNTLRINERMLERIRKTLPLIKFRAKQSSIKHSPKLNKREAFYLANYHKMTIVQMAKKLGISISSVASDLERLKLQGKIKPKRIFKQSNRWRRKKVFYLTNIGRMNQSEMADLLGIAKQQASIDIKRLKRELEEEKS
ncbi:MAG: hypothetical protein Q7S21_02380 [archaeon]|nr:hypothetical protein [archaeon]